MRPTELLSKRPSDRVSCWPLTFFCKTQSRVFALLGFALNSAIVVWAIIFFAAAEFQFRKALPQAAVQQALGAD